MINNSKPKILHIYCLYYIFFSGVFFNLFANTIQPSQAGGIYGWGSRKQINHIYQQANSNHKFIKVAAGHSHSLALKSDGSIVGWGKDGYGQATPPAGNNFVAIAAGYWHSLALKSDGSIIGWGSNSKDQASPPMGYDFVAIAAGANHSLALKSDGTIVAWGDDKDGMANVPVGKDFIDIAAGAMHSLALKSDGSIVGWGWNEFGQASPPMGNNYISVAAGDNHSIAIRSDGSIVGWGYKQDGPTGLPAGTNFIAADGGFNHSLALKSDGSIVGWGDDDYGQASVPVGYDFASIATGDSHSLALRSDGSIVGWGKDDYGQASPPIIYDDAINSGLIAIAARAYHSLALKSDGSIVGWGRDDYGQATPLKGYGYTAIAAGAMHSLALKSDGSIVGWGKDDYGQATPPEGYDYTAIAAGDSHSLALRSDGSIVGWGRDDYGQATPPVGNDFVAIAAGALHSLALKSDGSIVGWGDDYDGQATPPEGNNYIAITAGYWHSLALESDGSIVGWGRNWDNQASPPVGNDYILITAGYSHSLALKSDGSIVTWGSDLYGQLRHPSGNNFTAVIAGADYALALKSDGFIVGWGSDTYGEASVLTNNNYIAITTGNSHSLALKSDGSIAGWGNDNNGQATPPEGYNYTAIAAGAYHSLALKSDGSIVGWGDDDYGQASVPVGYDFASIATGDSHSLALRSDGSIVGWGRDDYGQATPPVGNDYTAIAAGAYHSLALKSDGSIVGWGKDDYGQATPPEGYNYTAIAAGAYHSLALKSDGSIAGWGRDDYGQATPPAGKDFIRVAGGRTHSVALKTDGSIVAWGRNMYGESLPPLRKHFLTIAAGDGYSLAIYDHSYDYTWDGFFLSPDPTDSTSEYAVRIPFGIRVSGLDTPIIAGETRNIEIDIEAIEKYWSDFIWDPANFESKRMYFHGMSGLIFLAFKDSAAHIDGQVQVSGEILTNQEGTITEHINDVYGSQEIPLDEIEGNPIIQFMEDGISKAVKFPFTSTVAYYWANEHGKLPEVDLPASGNLILHDEYVYDILRYGIGLKDEDREYINLKYTIPVRFLHDTDVDVYIFAKPWNDNFTHNTIKNLWVFDNEGQMEYIVSRPINVQSPDIQENPITNRTVAVIDPNTALDRTAYDGHYYIDRYAGEWGNRRYRYDISLCGPNNLMTGDTGRFKLKISTGDRIVENTGVSEGEFGIAGVVGTASVIVNDTKGGMRDIRAFNIRAYDKTGVELTPQHAFSPTQTLFGRMFLDLASIASAPMGGVFSLIEWLTEDIQNIPSDVYPNAFPVDRSSPHRDVYTFPLTIRTGSDNQVHSIVLTFDLTIGESDETEVLVHTVFKPFTLKPPLSENIINQYYDQFEKTFQFVISKKQVTHIPFEYGSTIIVNPEGGEDNPLDESLIIATPLIDQTDSTIAVDEEQNTVINPDIRLITTLGTNVSAETTFNDGDFNFTVMIPFEDYDLKEKDWKACNMFFFNKHEGMWIPATNGNTKTDDERHKRWVEERQIPTFSELHERPLGDYGVYWDPTLDKGFVWANVDHCTDFAAGILLGDSEPDGDVDFADLSQLSSMWLMLDTDLEWNSMFDISRPADGIINLKDLAVFSESWLYGVK